MRLNVPDELDVLGQNAILVDALLMAVQSTRSMDQVPMLLIKVINENRWQERTVGFGRANALPRYHRYAEFAKFVADPPLEGLGTTVDALRRLCRDDAEALDAIDAALRMPHGGDRRSEDRINVNNVNVEIPGPVRPQGNSAERALRALRDHAPELHAEVLAGRVSPHGAMVAAGLRRRTLTIPCDDPAAAARSIRRHFDAAAAAALARAVLAGLPAGDGGAETDGGSA